MRVGGGGVMVTASAREPETVERSGVSVVWRWVAIVLMVVLVFGIVGAVVWQASSEGDTSEFPTGMFVHEEFPSQVVLTFHEDGTWWMSNWDHYISGKYAVNGDLYTEMTHDFSQNRPVPATYRWAYDGEKLTFDLWGEDLVLARKGALDGQTYIKTE